MDINCDLGEGMPNDLEIMAYLGSCNIACGGHAGDRESMLATVQMAKRHNVKIGAHPSFEDRENFGRAEKRLSREKLRSQLIHQVAALNEIVKAEDSRLHHVKPHGALYNMAARSRELAEVVVDVVQFFHEDLVLYVPFDSVVERKAREAGLDTWVEVFADRNYDDAFRLLPRTDPSAVIEDPLEIRDRVERMFMEGVVVSVNGVLKQVRPDTVCFHGDHPRAPEIARKLYELTMRMQ